MIKYRNMNKSSQSLLGKWHEITSKSHAHIASCGHEVKCGWAHLQDGFENCVLHDGSRGGGSPDSGSDALQLRRCRDATSNTTALQHPWSLRPSPVFIAAGPYRSSVCLGAILINWRPLRDLPARAPRRDPAHAQQCDSSAVRKGILISLGMCVARCGNESKVALVARGYGATSRLKGTNARSDRSRRLVVRYRIILGGNARFCGTRRFRDIVPRAAAIPPQSDFRIFRTRGREYGNARGYRNILQSTLFSFVRSNTSVWKSAISIKAEKQLGSLSLVSHEDSRSMFARHEDSEDLVKKSGDQTDLPFGRVICVKYKNTLNVFSFCFTWKIRRPKWLSFRFIWKIRRLDRFIFGCAVCVRNKGTGRIFLLFHGKNKEIEPTFFRLCYFVKNTKTRPIFLLSRVKNKKTKSIFLLFDARNKETSRFPLGFAVRMKDKWTEPLSPLFHVRNKETRLIFLRLCRPREMYKDRRRLRVSRVHGFA